MANMDRVRLCQEAGNAGNVKSMPQLISRGSYVMRMMHDNKSVEFNDPSVFRLLLMEMSMIHYNRSMSGNDFTMNMKSSNQRDSGAILSQSNSIVLLTEETINTKPSKILARRIIERALNISLCHEEHVLNVNQHDMEVVGCEYQDEETGIVVAGTQLGDADANCNEFNWNLDCFTVTNVRTLHVSSSTFAIKSSLSKFCFKGIKESKKWHETIRISVSMELFTARPPLLDVTRVADQIVVALSKRYSNMLLHNLAMTLESTLFYWELIQSVLMGEAVQPFTDATKQYFTFCYKVSFKRKSFITIDKNMVVISASNMMLDCVAYPQRIPEDESGENLFMQRL
ncbi:hypothetical protein GQ457_14G016620 [Hibiscus cannabinus]